MRFWKPSSLVKRVGSRPVGSAGAIVAVSLFALLAAEPAHAQFFGPGPGLPPFAVRRIMVAHGFRVLAPPFRRGDVYVVDAVDGGGRQVRAIVDAFDGTIMQSFGVRGRFPVPPRRAFADERMPFPDEADEPEDGRGPRGRDGNGLFGFFAPPPRERAAVDPTVVPGIGPERSRPHHVVRPKPAPRTAVRVAPPLPGPPVTSVIVPSKPTAALPKPAAAPPKPTAALPRPAAAPPRPAATPPPPAAALPRQAAPAAVPSPQPVRLVPKSEPRRVYPPPTPTEATREPPLPSAAAKPSEERTPNTAEPRDLQAGATPRAPVDKSAAEKPAAAKATADGSTASKAKTSTETPKPAAKKRSGPLNDIPPAPLE